MTTIRCIDDRLPTVAQCLARAENARSREARSRDLTGKLFWRSLERSWKQTAQMLVAIEAANEFLEAA